MNDQSEGKKRKKRSPGWGGSGSGNSSRGSRGGYNSTNLGGHTVNHGNGRSTTTDNRGSISHYSDSGSRSSNSPTSIRSGGNSGSNRSTYSNSDHIDREAVAREQAARAATLEREQQARALLSQANSLAMLAIPAAEPAPVLSVSGVGSIALVETTSPGLLDDFSRGLNALMAFATRVRNATPIGFAIASIFHMEKLGVGSDQVPGRTRENFLSLSVPAKTMGLTDKAALVNAAKTTGEITIPARGKLSVKDRQLDISVVKPARPQSVRVVEATKDKSSGLYGHALTTGVSGVTTRTRESALAGQPALMAGIPGISVRSNRDSFSSAASTPRPFNHATRFHDVVVVYPEEAQLEPVYVMVEPILEDVVTASQQYHAEPVTEEIATPKGLVRVKSITPAASGEGLKGRWRSAVDGVIYEWNSKLAKLEVVQRPPQVLPGGSPVAGTPRPSPRVTSGRWETEVSGSGELVRVWVVEGILDQATGLYSITLPPEKDRPGRTILISPVKAPGTDGLGHLIHPEGRQVVILNTGIGAPVRSPTITVYPNPVLPDIDAEIAVPPLEVNYPPLYVMFNSPYGVTNAKGKYSGRDFNKDKAGGPILDLDWRKAIIDREGVNKVKLHTGRFGESLENKVMIERLEKILNGEIAVTDTDKRFYTHEIRELERYRTLGIKDGENPENSDEVWNNTHTATLEDYQLSSDERLLYTPEALD